MAAAASSMPQSSSTISRPRNSTMSTHATELIKGTHEFTVVGFSLQKRKGSGHFIESGSFNVGGFSWTVRLYPAGDRKEHEGHVSVYLHLQTTDVAKVRAKSTYHINGAGGANAASLPYGGTSTYTPASSTYGYSKLVKIDTLESRWLINDSFTLRCDVEVVKETETGTTTSRFVSVPPSGMFRHLEQLLESKEGSDVTFQVEHSEYDAHKAVLAARSPVFRAQFFGTMASLSAANQQQSGGRSSYVRIHDMRPEAFEAVLHFVYTDTLPPVEDEGFRQSSDGISHLAKLTEAVAGCSKENIGVIVRSMVGEWLAAADRFDLERMRLLCEDALWKTIDVANAEATLQLADLHHCTQLRAFCMEYLTSPRMLMAEVEAEGFKELKAACPSLHAEVMEKLGTATTRKSYII
uniref:BTB domain-containing protein n=1 Tax=Leersia perrieri TaxID=77586 RepID=A0A0D9X7Q1_9ORYZ